MRISDWSSDVCSADLTDRSHSDPPSTCNRASKDSFMRFCALGLSGSAALLLMTSSAQAQEMARSGQVADSAVGQVGQRQTAENSQANIEPMGRLNNRIPNRVQTRIRNQIDPTYNPHTTEISPFQFAAEKKNRE